MMSFY